jgi:hypothetical protein
VVKRHPESIRRFLKRGGKPAAIDTRRPIPGDWGLYCNEMTKHQLARHYSTCIAVINRWIAEKGRNYKPKSSAHPPKPIPADFVEVSKRLGTRTAVAAHYGIGRETERRWRVKLGLHTVTGRPRSTVGWAERYVQERRAA